MPMVAALLPKGTSVYVKRPEHIWRRKHGLPHPQDVNWKPHAKPELAVVELYNEKRMILTREARERLVYSLPVDDSHVWELRPETHGLSMYRRLSEYQNSCYLLMADGIGPECREGYLRLVPQGGELLLPVIRIHPCRVIKQEPYLHAVSNNYKGRVPHPTPNVPDRA
jgi:hypothetical protein